MATLPIISAVHEHTMNDSRIALLTATPDLVAGGLLPELASRLAANGFQVAAALPFVFSDAQSFMLYAGKVTHIRSEQGKLHASWLSPRLFSGGVSVVLILRVDTEAEGLHAQQRLCLLKGGSRWGEAGADQLRGISPGCDRSLSFVHSPDDFCGVLHELQLLFGRDLADWAQSAEALGRTAVPSTWLPLLAPAAPTTILSTRSLLAWPWAVQRALAIIAADPLSAVDIAKVIDAFNKTENIGEEISSATALQDATRIVWSKLAELRSGLAEIHQQVMIHLNGADDPISFSRAAARATLSRALVAICEMRPIDPRASLLLFDAFTRIGSPLSHWEAQRLHLGAAYHGD